MSTSQGVRVSDQWLQSQFSQAQLRSLKSKYIQLKRENGKVTTGMLPPLLVNLKPFNMIFKEEEIKEILCPPGTDEENRLEFEPFLRAYINLNTHASKKLGNSKNASSFLKATTTVQTIQESEKEIYVAHINNYLRDDKYMKQFLPIDSSTNALFDLVKDGVVLCKLVNLAVPNTIDDRAINSKKKLNLWERNENHTLFLNSAKAIGCTVVNVGSQDLAEGKPHLVLGLISQIIKIQLLADLNLKKTPELLELLDDEEDAEELVTLSPEKVLLKWMNFHLKKAGYQKTVTNFNADLKDGEAYAHLLNVLAPEYGNHKTLDSKDPVERANLVLRHAEKIFDTKTEKTIDSKTEKTIDSKIEKTIDSKTEKTIDSKTEKTIDSKTEKTIDSKTEKTIDSKTEKTIDSKTEKINCKAYLTPKDIVEGSTNLNLAFVAQLFQKRSGLSNDTSRVKVVEEVPKEPKVCKENYAEMMIEDEQVSREERWFRLWINSLGISSYVDNVFEDIRDGWIILVMLDKVSPGSVNWKLTTKPPIKMPFRKVENCNQAVRIGKRLRFSLVNIQGNDIVQGNKKLILAFLWQLMRYNMLQLLKHLRARSHEITDGYILRWANRKVKSAGKTSEMESFKDKRLSNGIFFLELLTAVAPQVVNWSLVTKGITADEKKLNATYIISVARKLGCSIFSLPEDIMEVNQKMILMLTASIMYYYLQITDEPESTPASVANTPNASPAFSYNGDDEGSFSGTYFNMTIDDANSDVAWASNIEDIASM